MGFIKDRIENFKQKRMFTAQNCINHQIELKQREERRQIEEEKRNYEALIGAAITPVNTTLYVFLS